MTNKELSNAYKYLGDAYKMFDGKSNAEINRIKETILSAQSQINTYNMQREYTKTRSK